MMQGGSIPSRLSRALQSLALVFLMVLTLGLGLPVSTLAQEGADPATAATSADDGLVVEALEEVTTPQPSAETLEWERTAKRAEDALEAGLASDAALESLRAELVTWRETFQDAQEANAQRIANLRNQIAVLGTPPENATESVEITLRRSDLNTQLSQLLAPVLAAEEARSRASGLIAEIDSTLRTRQTDALLAIGPSPVNPVYWAAAWNEVQAGLNAMRAEFRSNYTNELRQFEFRQNLLVIIPLFLLGLVLMLRGRAWATGLVRHLRAHAGRAAEPLAFVASLSKSIVPWIGLLLLVQSLLATGFFGLKGETFLQQIPLWGVALYAAHWLCDRLFPVPPAGSLFDVPPERRGQMRRLGATLAIFVVLSRATESFEAVNTLSAATGAILAFPILVLTSLALTRLARQVRVLVQPRLEESEEGVAFRLRAVSMLARGAILVALVGPVLAGIGYRNAAEALVYPTAVTAGLLGLLFAMQYFTEQTYALFSRRDGDSSDALLPALIGVAMVLASVPVLALIWGMRATDLTELWSRFLEGVSVGDTRISPSDFIAFAVFFGAGYLVTRLVQGALKTSVLPKTRIDQGGQTAIVSGVGYVGITLAALVAFAGTGLDLSSIAIVAGALSVGIGFGLQTIVSNFVSGIILLIERPISEGDWIEVGGQMGYVRDISVRATRIETFDRTDVIIPNADLVSGTVTNYTRGNTVGRVIVSVGVAYGTDTHRVEGILREIAEDHPMVLANPAPAVLFQGFGADSLDFEIRAILRDVNWALSVRSEMNHAIAARFAEEGIEIPFAQRDVWLRNPEVLQPQATDAPATAEAEAGQADTSKDTSPKDKEV
jgi:small-conductance mechanosensitive channel